MFLNKMLESHTEPPIFADSVMSILDIIQQG
jgi:hypothetical protein